MLRKMLLSAGVVAAGLVAVPAQPAVGEEVCAQVTFFAPPPGREAVQRYCHPSPFHTFDHLVCTGSLVQLAAEVCVQVTTP